MPTAEETRIAEEKRSEPGKVMLANELAGKHNAAQVYDERIWKIRTGFLTLTFASWGALLAVGPGLTAAREGAGPLLAITLALAIAGFAVEFFYVCRKARCVKVINEMSISLYRLLQSTETAGEEVGDVLAALQLKPIGLGEEGIPAELHRRGGHACEERSLLEGAQQALVQGLLASRSDDDPEARDVPGRVDGMAELPRRAHLLRIDVPHRDLAGGLPLAQHPADRAADAPPPHDQPGVAPGVHLDVGEVRLQPLEDRTGDGRRLDLLLRPRLSHVDQRNVIERGRGFGRPANDLDPSKRLLDHREPSARALRAHGPEEVAPVVQDDQRSAPARAFPALLDPPSHSRKLIPIVASERRESMTPEVLLEHSHPHQLVPHRGP